jgi:MFS family permease
MVEGRQSRLTTQTLPAKYATGLRLLCPWYTAEMLGSYATTLLTAGVYWYAADILKAGDSTRLWLAASFGYVYIACAFFGGQLTERFGPRCIGILMIGGCVAAAIFGLITTRMMGLAGLGIALLLFNVTSTPLWPAIETAITHAPGTLSLPTRTGVYNILWSATNFLAFFTVGKIFEQQKSLTFYIAAGLSLLGLVILACFTRRPNETDHHVQEPAEYENNPALLRRSTRLLHMAWVGNALAYVAIQTLVPVIPTLAHNLHLSTPAIGASVSSVWAFTRTLFFILVLWWTSWHYSIRYLLGFQVLLAVTFFLAMRLDHLGLPSPTLLPVFILLQAGFGAAVGFTYSSSLYYAMHVSRGKGGHAGIHEALIGFGIAIGPTIGAIAGPGTSTDPLSRVAYSVTAMLVAGTLAMFAMGLTAAPRESAK